MRRRTVEDLRQEIRVKHAFASGQHKALLEMVGALPTKTAQKEVRARLKKPASLKQMGVESVCASNMSPEEKVQVLAGILAQAETAIRAQEIISMFLRPAAATANAVRKPEEAVQQIREGLKRAADAAEAFAKNFPEKADQLKRTLQGEIVTHFRRLTRFFIS